MEDVKLYSVNRNLNQDFEVIDVTPQKFVPEALWDALRISSPKFNQNFDIDHLDAQEAVVTHSPELAGNESALDHMRVASM
jgi:hypothetical protein